MNRDRQIRKNWENKKLQAREEYAKNKPLLSGSIVHEKANDYNHPIEANMQDESVQMDTALDKASE